MAKLWMPGFNINVVGASGARRRGSVRSDTWARTETLPSRTCARTENLSSKDLQLSWSVNRHLTMVAILTYFRTGRFIKETPPSRNVGYSSIYFTYRF